MKIQIIDGDVTEVTQQDWQAFEAWRKEQAKDWPQDMNEYWFLGNIGEIHSATWNRHSLDFGRQSIGNIYRTEAEALAQVEKLKAKARIDKYIAENGLAFVPDWSDMDECKSWIIYDHDDKLFAVDGSSWGQTTSIIFASSGDAQQVIDNCTDDLKTIFGVK